MGNPLVHAIAFAAAVIIPGGLLVYFAWRSISLKRTPNHTAQKQGSEDIPSAEEALQAYLEAFPKYSKESLRAKSRADRLRISKTRPRKKSQ
jgi:hypothetical protein